MPALMVWRFGCFMVGSPTHGFVRCGGHDRALPGRPPSKLTISIFFGGPHRSALGGNHCPLTGHSKGALRRGPETHQTPGAH
jgi:hypothetical protein